MNKTHLMLKRPREHKGLTQQEVASELGVKVATYRTWEQGSVNITLENALRVSSVIGCTPNDLCDWYSTRPRTVVTDESPDTQRLLSAYKELSEEGREVAVNVLTGLTAAYPKTNSIKKSTPIPK